MPDYVKEVYAALPETRIYNKTGKGKRSVNCLLMGTWLGVTEEKDDWFYVKTIGPDGWVRQDQTREDMGLKLFFIDVGQGDACLIESPTKRILVDGGPSNNVMAYLTSWKYKWMLTAGPKVIFDAVFVSHFDYDHFNGLIPLINDTRFEFKAIYHNGIARFHSQKNQRPAKYDTDLGTTDAFGQPNHKRSILKTSFSSLSDAKTLLSEGGLQSSFKDFLTAAVNADTQGRLGELKRLTLRDGRVPGFTNPADLLIDIIGPVTASPGGPFQFKWFKDSSHTRNGHSLILRLTYKNRNFLMGGDLNSHSEDFLLDYYKPQNPFWVDVAKACHHGASEFTVDFMKAIQPYATVISSGDNENYSHPRADALGCAGRYSRGERPLVFSTELARSIKSGRGIHYGLINCRTDGDQVVVAQMLEKRRGADLWDSYSF